MKKFVCAILIFLLSIGIVSCRSNISQTDHSYDSFYYQKFIERVEFPLYNYTPTSKRNVDKFYDAFKKSKVFENYYSKLLFCNVTPPFVYDKTNAEIFVEDYYGAPYILIDNEAYKLCERYGAANLSQVVPWDYDKDGIEDLLVLMLNGSGMPRHEFYLFDMKTKKYSFLCDSYGIRANESRATFAYYTFLSEYKTYHYSRKNILDLTIERCKQ